MYLCWFGCDVVHGCEINKAPLMCGWSVVAQISAHANRHSLPRGYWPSNLLRLNAENVEKIFQVDVKSAAKVGFASSARGLAAAECHKLEIALLLVTGCWPWVCKRGGQQQTTQAAKTSMHPLAPLRRILPQVTAEELQAKGITHVYTFLASWAAKDISYTLPMIAAAADMGFLRGATIVDFRGKIDAYVVPALARNMVEVCRYTCYMQGRGPADVGFANVVSWLPASCKQPYMWHPWAGQARLGQRPPLPAWVVASFLTCRRRQRG